MSMTGVDLDALAATVEQYMPDTVIIKRETGREMNPVSMEEEPIYTEIYNGKAFVTPMGDPAGTLRASEAVQRVQYEVGVPRECPPVKPNDVVEVITSADPDWAAREPLYVHDEINATFFTHRRIKAFRDQNAVQL